jgi:beta-phosphoglucomutase
MMLNDVKGVIFDLDGVIADTAKFHFLAWKKLAGEIGFDLHESFDERLKGVGRLECLEIILEAASAESYASGGRTVCAPTADEKAEMAERKNGYYLEHVKTMTKADILPGIKELITLLKGRGCKLAIASSSFNAPYVLSTLGLDCRFDYVVDVSKLTHGKPNPDIFIRACLGLGLTAEVCVGIEDSKAGIEAIKAANITAIGVGCERSLKDADIVVKDTMELVKIFS